MKRLMVALAFAAVSLPAALLAVSTYSDESSPQPPATRGAVSPRGGGAAAGHNKPLPPFIAKREQERLAAADRVARGLATPTADGLVQLRDGKLVRYRLEGTEYLTAALVDFSDLRHGNIPQPNRSVDNSTYWSADVSPQHYEDMLFTPGGGSYGLPSMHDFYLEQSSGRFTWTGQVANWVQLNATAASFGANSPKTGAGGDDANGVVYRVVDATLKALAASGNYGGIDLARADSVDRYDCDGDGVYFEPDGYIDHFAVVHAGEGEEAGGGALGGDAIWSHRWYANYNTDNGPAGCHLGGYQLPGTGLWVGDYTIEPENGGVGVFAHEFGHDLGLPDLYDTAGPTDNGTGFWSIMSSGSWASDSPYAIGDKPVHMGAWEKLALGWLGDNLARVQAGQDVTVEIGPAESASRGRYQALRIDLPNIRKTTTLFATDGSDPNYYYSTKGNEIDTSMTRALSLAAATPISFRANWNIEKDWDYAYLDALVAGVWQHIQTSASTTTNPNDQNFGFGITGVSSGWTTVTATLPAGTTAIRFRYWTDPAVIGLGFAVDTINIGGIIDNATTTAAWTFNGFVQLTNAQFTESFFHYYLAESRNYLLNDTSLCGAYNFLSGNWLEKQCYADGLLIWYRNSSFADNNTSQHPGGGQILPIDAHPAANVRPDGRTVWSSRWQTWEATFGVTDHQVTLSQVISKARTLTASYAAPAVAQFFDATPTTYYNASIPWNSVKTAGSGVKLDIVGISADGASYRVRTYK
jgi:immune inhibitor A